MAICLMKVVLSQQMMLEMLLVGHWKRYKRRNITIDGI